MLNYSRRPVLHPKDTFPAKSEVSTFIVDMMAAIRTLTALPDIHGRLTWKFIKSLPSGYHRIDIVADTYQDPSIKSEERSKFRTVHVNRKQLLKAQYIWGHIRRCINKKSRGGRHKGSPSLPSCAAVLSRKRCRYPFSFR